MTKDMTNDIQSTQPGGPQQGEIILYQPDETVRLEVRLEDDTVWLTQQQMAELFGKDRTVIGRHIRNVYNEGELQQDITCAKFAQTTVHGAIAGKEHSNRPVDIAAFTHPFHDRFLIIDYDLWHCGASFKDLGRRLFAIDRLNIDKNVILGQL